MQTLQHMSHVACHVVSMSLYVGVGRTNQMPFGGEGQTQMSPRNLELDGRRSHLPTERGTFVGRPVSPTCSGRPNVYTVQCSPAQRPRWASAFAAVEGSTRRAR